ncbi:competence type IV pilus major pilin ComGC [Bacillus niameyensis]|uniref:competence type IV pilus major pilin ComGC n=1 Tax=Bacillus niameyensis TaxID=1522308 RepID=UPI000B2D5214|nr:competence type IV pilus major pilin ComGC [Bacillus niameyensis]
MKKYIQNQKAFTLIEMLIVLLIISVILLVALPNVTKHSETINKKGCEALIQMVQGQVQAYHMEKQEYPTNFRDLEDAGYIKSADLQCPDGSNLVIANGVVKEASKQETP